MGPSLLQGKVGREACKKEGRGEKRREGGKEERRGEEGAGRTIGRQEPVRGGRGRGDGWEQGGGTRKADRGGGTERGRRAGGRAEGRREVRIEEGRGPGRRRGEGKRGEKGCESSLDEKEAKPTPQLSVGSTPFQGCSPVEISYPDMEGAVPLCPGSAPSFLPWRTRGAKLPPSVF